MKFFRLFFPVFLLLLTTSAISFAQAETTDGEQKLSEINWDEEISETSEENKPLSEVDWGEEEEADADIPDLKNVTEIDRKPRFSHWLNGFLFLVYLAGCFVTAFITRNMEISKRTPPEILIILHTFWPLELLLIPFFKR